MSKDRFTLGAMLVFFVVAAMLGLFVNYEKPRILVVHSYDKDYVWCREVSEGLNRAFQQTQWFTLRYHFMRTKKFSSPDELRRASVAAKQAIDKFQPDVLIAIDDYAQKLAAKFYVNNPKIDIVFAGVNSSIEPYGYHLADNVTGILERKQIQAVKEVLGLLSAAEKVDNLADRPIRVSYISDPALSGKIDCQYLAAYDWRPFVYQGGIVAENFEMWQKNVLELQGKTDFLLVSGYRKLPYSMDNAQFVPPAEVMQWTEKHSSVPVIGLNVFNTGDGAMLSVGVSPYEQGEVAGRMALAIVSGKKSVAEISVRTSSQYVISIRESAVKRRGIILPKVFEAFARATDNYYE